MKSLTAFVYSAADKIGGMSASVLLQLYFLRKRRIPSLHASIYLSFPLLAVLSFRDMFLFRSKRARLFSVTALSPSGPSPAGCAEARSAPLYPRLQAGSLRRRALPRQNPAGHLFQTARMPGL